MFVNEKEIFKFKASDGIVNFLPQFFLGIIYYGFGSTESREVSLKGSLYDFIMEAMAHQRKSLVSILV